MRWAMGLVIGVGLVGCAGTGRPVPPELAFPPGETEALRVRAAGVQIYECKAAAGGAALEWSLVAPEAQLYDGAGTLMGRHYGGPTWEALDGSKVVGKLAARADAPEPDAIPWLRLSAATTEGSGVFGKVKSIQRIETVGGKAPAGCSQAGETLRVPYSAAYRFSRAG